MEKLNKMTNIIPNKVIGLELPLATSEFVAAVYLLTEGRMIPVEAETGYYYAVQTDNGNRNGWHTCWYLPGYDLEDAQKEAAKLSRKRKCLLRVVRMDWVKTVIEPERKTKRKVSVHD